MCLALVMFLSVAEFIQGETKCYIKTGCVTNDPPYTSETRPNSTFPQSPESINTQFFLFRKNNMDSYQIISNRKLLRDLPESHYDCKKKSVFIIHGYLDYGNDTWLIEMCKEILKLEDVNCLCVDWSGGAWGDYYQAINNIQVVGGEIAFFIEMTKESCQCNQSGIHLIGHGLGAHAAGEAGKRRPGIDKITCLDAARFGFEEESDEVSVDPSDAKFVVAIHTDIGAYGVGMMKLIGHKDFYPNGGETMTKCRPTFSKNWMYSLRVSREERGSFLCNHFISRHMFTASIPNPDGFMGYCAPDYESFQEGAGFPCFNGSCSIMGYYTEPDASSCRSYYLNTGPHTDYKRYRYNATVETNVTNGFKGYVKLVLYKCYQRSQEYRIDIKRGDCRGRSGNNFTKMIDSRYRPPHLQTRLYTFAYVTTSVTLVFGNTGDVYKFSGHLIQNPCTP